ncbi:MAG TPA: hypothetical protein EYM59_08250 [Acidimicrobiia bacterium]|nr:hypothetical protein [Acidimicrobiia bacterium]
MATGSASTHSVGSGCGGIVVVVVVVVDVVVDVVVVVVDVVVDVVVVAAATTVVGGEATGWEPPHPARTSTTTRATYLTRPVHHTRRRVWHRPDSATTLT